jgi:succinylglutamic semialdehyde dehydrogenase
MTFEIKGNYFDGHYQSNQGSTSSTITRECPADISRTLWKFDVALDQIDSIIDSAINGHKFWRKQSIAQRCEFLKRYQEIVISKKGIIAEAIALESGKPLWEAMTEAAAISAKVDVTINDSLPRINDVHIENILPNTNGHVYYKPIGPCLIIGPFNFPCHLANTQILSALISGNSIIFKPSEKTAYSGQLLIDCFHEAGFPQGVINLVQGGGEAARRVLKNKNIKGIFFTGSKEVGKKILKDASNDLGKMVALELGGKNTSIVHKDANIDLVLEEVIKGAFLTTGQRCTSTGIVAIHENIKDEVLERFHTIAKKIIVDHPIDFEKEPFMGPLVDKKSLENYLLYMGMAKREGLEEIMRGKHLERRTQGHYVSPSIHFAEKWDSNSHFLASEIFGPNCTFVSYKEIDEAIAITNSTEYGLASSVFTKDQSLFEQCLDDLDTGLVNLNRSTSGAHARLPFGGIKNSGNYKPAAVAMIDSCVYQKASLVVNKDVENGLGSIKGLDL